MSNVPDRDLQIDHKFHDSVDRLARDQRDVVLSKVLGGIVVSSRTEDDVATIKKMAKRKGFYDALKLHNVNPKQHHFNEHEILYTNFQFDENLHDAITTGHNIMNVARAINAGTFDIQYGWHFQD